MRRSPSQQRVTSAASAPASASWLEAPPLPSSRWAACGALGSARLGPPRLARHRHREAGSERPRGRLTGQRRAAPARPRPGATPPLLAASSERPRAAPVPRLPSRPGAAGGRREAGGRRGAAEGTGRWRPGRAAAAPVIRRSEQAATRPPAPPPGGGPARRRASPPSWPLPRERDAPRRGRYVWPGRVGSGARAGGVGRARGKRGRAGGSLRPGEPLCPLRTEPGGGAGRARA